MSVETYTEAIRLLRDAFPREPMSDATVRVYSAELGVFPADDVLAATRDAVRRATFRPSIGEILRRLAEKQLDLPTEEEAWMLASRGSWQDAPATVKQAAEYVGGRYAIRVTERPETIRAQFRQAYRNIRDQEIQDYIGTGGQPALAQSRRLALPTSPTMGPTMRSLPVTERGPKPGPVMSRWIERLAGRPPGPPDEAEIRDAIRILETGSDHPDPSHDPLYAEAERVHAEASV